jgi:hypothetical protein
VKAASCILVRGMHVGLFLLQVISSRPFDLALDLLGGAFSDR